MSAHLLLDILPQPDDTTCGPTCLHAVYDYYGDVVPLQQVIDEVRQFEEGGTLAVFLGCHALRRGYRATIYTYNLQMFDPTWFVDSRVSLREKLLAQDLARADLRLRMATKAYIEFLDRGGHVRFEDLTTRLIRRYLTRGVPILTGLSATYLHRSIREFGITCEDDDVRGVPVGHFVVLCGYDRKTREVMVADPIDPNPLADSHVYSVRIDRVLGAILLGIITHDANLLIIEKPARTKRKPPDVTEAQRATRSDPA